MTYNVIFTKKKKARRIKNENHCVYNNELIVVKKKKEVYVVKKCTSFYKLYCTLVETRRKLIYAHINLR